MKYKAERILREINLSNASNKSLIYGNTTQNIFANGTAFQVTKTYSDSSGYKKFAVKVFYTNGSTDECYTPKMVHVTPASGMQ